ncbi:MAG: class I SAM-dependent methyltransferase [Chloroflexi bacterium]|nr:class I SAM-dependent methyltransferase [Chloroflexota bacterium]
MRYSPRDWRLLTLIVIGFTLTAIVLMAFLDWLGMALAMGLLLSLIVFVQFSLFRRLYDRMEEDYRQTEALFSLFALLDLQAPFPALRRWSIAPDFGNVLLMLIREQRPKLIVELGTGSSTLISAYTLKALGEGRVVSVEHQAAFADLSRQQLERHKLSDWSEVIHAPLESLSVNTESWDWYQVAAFADLGPIDLLVVDGPPQFGNSRRQARYPALPVLIDQLAPDGTILVDDANRADEGQMVERWLREFPDFAVQRLDTEKGTIILRRKL